MQTECNIYAGVCNTSMHTNLHTISLTHIIASKSTSRVHKTTEDTPWFRIKYVELDCI